MARSRSIKPGFFKNEELAELGPEAMLCFAGLWTLADRAGRLEDRPKRIRAELFPYSPECDIEVLLDGLARSGFIVRYRVGLSAFIAIPSWSKHQNPHVKESASTIPAPDEPGASPVLDPEIPERAGLTPSSLTPDSLDSDPLHTDNPAQPEPARVSAKRASPTVIHPHPSKRFEEVWSKWPRKAGKDAAARDWLSVVSTANEQQVLDCIERYLSSDDVKRGAVRHLGTMFDGGSVKRGWLVDCAADNWESDWPRARDAPPSKTRQQENADAWSRA